MTNTSFISIVREKNIVINAYDLNAMLTTLLAHPSFRCVGSSWPLCFPGVSDEGYLYLTVKYFTPNIGVVFVSLNAEDFYDCMAKAISIGQALRQEQLLTPLENAIIFNYLQLNSIVPNGTLCPSSNLFRTPSRPPTRSC
jgi:hypothetical protein